jgi:hypothetical protein
MAQFVSYAVGCMMGRYSLDKEGLILANQGETLEDYVRKVSGEWWMVDGNGWWQVVSGELENSQKLNQDEYQKLQRPEDLAAKHEAGQGGVPADESDAEGGTIQSDQSNQTGGGEHSEQHSRGAGEGHEGVRSFPPHSPGFTVRTGDPAPIDSRIGDDQRGTNTTPDNGDNEPEKTNQRTYDQTQNLTTHQSPITNHQSPGTTHHPPITFWPDEDAIIPVLDDEWFEDDIVGRIYEFLKVTFGEKDFQRNLSFVQDKLGKDLRKYFVRDFYNDHVKRYKKRPIYWLFSSPRGSFNALIYLHRYTPDTLNNLLNNYLREFIQKLKAQREHYRQLQVSGTSAEQNQATKRIEQLDKMILDCEQYERDILYPLATERIALDLDDGVLVNYNKLGQAVKEVKGLNDAKTKKKVRGFDWIDKTKIK